MWIYIVRFVQCPIHTADATQMSSWVASGVGGVYRTTEFATSSRQLPTDSVDNLDGNWPSRLYSGLTTWILIDIDNLSTMTSLCRHLSPTLIAQQHRKLSTGSRLPTGAFTPLTRRNSTSLLANLFRLVETVAIKLCELRTHSRRDSTRQLSRVGGVSGFTETSDARKFNENMELNDSLTSDVTCKPQRTTFVCRTRVSSCRRMIRVFWTSPAPAWIQIPTMPVMTDHPVTQLRHQCRRVPRRWMTRDSAASRRRARPPQRMELAPCPRCRQRTARTPGPPTSASRRPRVRTCSRSRSKICH